MLVREVRQQDVLANAASPAGVTADRGEQFHLGDEHKQTSQSEQASKCVPQMSFAEFREAADKLAPHICKVRQTIAEVEQRIREENWPSFHSVRLEFLKDKALLEASTSLMHGPPLWLCYLLKCNGAKDSNGRECYVYYVGRATIKEFKNRMMAHVYGAGSAWTRSHPPVDILEVWPCWDGLEEDLRTVRLMDEKGIDNVRGGRFSNPDLKEDEVQEIQKQLDNAADRCRYCHKEGHFITECPIRKDDLQQQRQQQQQQQHDVYAEGSSQDPPTGCGTPRYLPGPSSAPTQGAASSGPAALSGARMFPRGQRATLSVAAQSSSGLSMSTDDKWRLVFDRPDQWWDNRGRKQNPKAPDFKHKDRDMDIALWLSSRDTPAWAKDRLTQHTMQLQVRCYCDEPAAPRTNHLTKERFQGCRRWSPSDPGCGFKLPVDWLGYG